MEIINILIGLISVILLCKSFYNLIVQSFVYNNNSINDKFYKEQKSCDLIMLIHDIFKTLFWFWLTTVIIINTFNSFYQVFNNIGNYNTSFIIILTIIGIIYYITNGSLFVKYNIEKKYFNILKKREEQEVVTEDNDYEVNLIKTYNNIINSYWHIIVLYVISVILYEILP